ncbi:MAG: hypothetical protein AAFX53_09710 [Bacteroidota bacterium]
MEDTRSITVRLAKTSPDTSLFVWDKGTVMKDVGQSTPFLA